MNADTYPVSRKLANGASVADWLGTAKTAAEVAVLLIERVRLNTTTVPTTTLDRVERELEQALEEVRFVRESVEGRCVRSTGITQISQVER